MSMLVRSVGCKKRVGCFKRGQNILDIAHLPLDDPPIRERYWDDADRNTSSRSPKQLWSRMKKSLFFNNFLLKIAGKRLNLDVVVSEEACCS